MANFSDTVVNMTYKRILPKVVNDIVNTDVMLARRTANSKRWTGLPHCVNFVIDLDNTGGSFAGMDTFSTQITNNVRQLSFYPKGFEQPVNISGMEKSVNANTDAQAISLIANKLDEARVSMSDAVASQFYTGSIADPSGKQFTGLEAIVDDGTNTASYGGQTRAGLPILNSTVVAAAGGTLSLGLMGEVWDEVSNSGSEDQSPTILVTDKPTWRLYEMLIPQTRTNYKAENVEGYNVVTGRTPTGVTVRGKSAAGSAGFVALDYRGVGIVRGEKCPAGTMYFLNERTLDFMNLKGDGLRSFDVRTTVSEGAYSSLPNLNAIQFRDFLAPVNQYGESAHLFMLGDVVCRNPRRNGKITGITTV